MPPRNKRLPAPVEPPLPPLEPLDENLPSIDPPPEFLEEMNGVPADEYAVPDEVYNDFASEPSAPAEELPQTGMGFDFNSVNVQTREDFDALPLEQQELLKAMKRGVQFTPATAAQFILKQQTARQERESKMEMMQADPVRKERADAQARANREAMEKRAGVMDEIASTRTMITSMLEHPGFSGSVGMKNASYLFGMKEEPISGTKEADFYPYIKQIRGGAFLKAFERIKGGGQITEIEGEKATDAIIRAQTSQSEEGFRKSMADFLDVINSVEKRMLESGQGASSPSAAAPTAQTAAPRNTFTYDGATYERLPDGTARLIE
jgi:hypothetical protein